MEVGKVIARTLPLMLITMLALTGAVHATTHTGNGVEPILVTVPNVSCATLNADDATYPGIMSDYGFKYDANPTGDVSSTIMNNPPWTKTGGAPDDPNNTISILNVGLDGSGEGISFDWTATLGIDAVIVKAQDSNAYVYPIEAFSDTGLVAPDGKSISHVEFCYDYELTAAKTAETSFVRTYTWSIEKAVDPASHSGFVGESFVSNYDVTVDRIVTDSNWQVSGVITVTNNTPFTATFSVTDTVGGTTPATVSCPTLTLAPGASTDCTYSADMPDGSDGTNTATVTSSTAGVGGATAAAPYAFGEPTTINGFPTVNVTDTFDGGAADALGSASELTTFEYTRGFDCPTDPSFYTNGQYQFTKNNTAEITETGQTDTEAVTVTCYAPVVTKDAAGSFDETWTWTVEKSVDPASQSGFFGDPLDWTWTVTVSESSEASGYAVTGTIFVQNPNPGAPMTVTVSDQLDDGTIAAVDCGDGTATLTVAAGTTGQCSYTASPADASATLNTATAAFNGGNYSGSAAVAFTANVINGTATLDDPEVGANGLVLTAGDGGTRVFTGDDSDACSTDSGLYAGDGSYEGSDDNTATLTPSDSGAQEASASTAWTCYAPVVTKDAAGSFDRTWTWTIEKSVDPASQSGFFGDPLDWTWTVTVSESSADSNFAVSGTIFVQNPAGSPGSMTVSLTDQLDDGTFATVDCGGGATSITVATGATGSCSYTAAPADAGATLNTATGTFNGGSFSGTAAVAFAANVINGTATLDDPEVGANGLVLTAGDGGTRVFTGDDSDACSTDTGLYAGDGSYEDSDSNTATLTPSDSGAQEASASTTWTCYAPVVTKDAAGSYDERHIWDIDKTVEIDSATGFPGDTITWTWTITVSETFVNENYAVTGSIFVQNPAGSPGSMTVSLTDQLDDGTFATVDCGGGAASITVATGATGSCSYTAAPADGSATLNTATGTFNGGSFSGTAAVSFAVTVIDGEATLSDPDQGVEQVLIAGEGPWTITDLIETDVCAVETSTQYGDNGQYTVEPDNTATVTTGTTSTTVIATAETAFTCYVPGRAKVIKTTTEGDEDIGQFPFSFELYDPDGTLQETVNLNGAGEAIFTTDLEAEGDWTVEEVLPDGWVSTTDLTCTFNVTYPAAADFTFECTFDNVEKSRIDLLKLTNGVPREDQTWSFALYEGPDGFGGTEVASDSTPPSLLDFDNTDLDPFAVYTLCELGVPAGYSSVWRVDLDGDGVFETGLMPYNPNADDDPPEDLGNRCIEVNYDSDGVNGADVPLTPGTTLSFEVDNQKPGGAPRTPGYWKNWNTCTGGQQQYTAANNGGWQEGFWLLEDVLDPNIGGGIVWDDILDDTFEFPITTCEVAVDILDKRLVGDPAIVGDGRKQANDPLHNLATHLLAAQLNFGAGACDTQEVRDKALEAEELLDKYDFDGNSHKPLSKKDPDTALANDLATFLDNYNNGEECGDNADKPNK